MSLVRGCRLVTLYSCTPPRWLRHVSPPCSYFLSQVRLSAGHRLRRHLDVGCRDTQGADTHAKTHVPIQNFSPENARSRSRCASTTPSRPRSSIKPRGSSRIRLARGSNRRCPLSLFSVVLARVSSRRPPLFPFPFPFALHVTERTLKRMVVTMDDRLNVTPENVWGTFHGVVGLLMVVWWQLTLRYASAFRGSM